MYKMPFKVAPFDGADQVEYVADMPDSMDDEALIIARYGSVERMILCANKEWRVGAAPGIRKRQKQGDWTGAEQYATTFCHNGSKDVYRPTLSEKDKEEGDFTEAQLAILARKGMKV